MADGTPVNGLRADVIARHGVALLRDNETQLHAGLCQKGRWVWLR